MSARIRHFRITYLTSMAIKGKSDKDLFDKAKSWGVSNPTASDYVQTVKAMIKSKGKRK